MRIVGGSLRGRKLHGPETDAIRPTSDRLREALFNVLAHAYEDALSDTRVLDLFAGTGALSFEALSRGASFALLVDEGMQARGLIRRNIETLGLEGTTKLYRRDATKLGPANAVGAFSLVFCDPPYGRDLAPRALASAAEGGWLEAGALIVVEESVTVDVVLPDTFQVLDRREYGETALGFWRYATP